MPEQSINIDFPWPTPSGLKGKPVWNGRGFHVDGRSFPVLSFEVGAAGWTDDLTTFHEHTAGDSHFIDMASRRHAVSQVTSHASQGLPVILDIGCSSGFLLEDLRTAFPDALIMGADVVLRPLLNLAKRSPAIPLLHFDLTSCPLPTNSIDVAVLLNVLEHIEDDTLAVKQLFRILKPGGIAIVEVPAGPELFDIYDELLMHFRRYKMSTLSHMFLQTGFSVLKRSHLGFFIYPGFFAVKKMRRKKRADISEEEIAVLVSQSINQTGRNPFFHLLMEMELMLGKIVSYPFGIRCLLTCIKPK